MLRPSGEICGSLTHCKSKMSSGLSSDLPPAARQSAGNVRRINAATPELSLERSACRSVMPIPFACKPAVTLMFIDHSHGLHEGVANSRSYESEPALLEILAHRVALRGRLCNAAQV